MIKNGCSICRKAKDKSWLGFPDESFEIVKAFFSSYGRLDGDWTSITRQVVRCRKCKTLYDATFFSDTDVTGESSSYNLVPITEKELKKLTADPPAASDIPGFHED
jgi:hypothetical protein